MELQQLLPTLQQLTATLATLLTTLQAQLPAGQAQAAAAAAQPAGSSVGGGSGGDQAATASGGGSSVRQALPAGCGCGMAVAQAAGANPVPSVSAPGDRSELPPAAASDAPAPAPAAGAGGKLDAGGLTVKGEEMDAEQRRNVEAVLQVGVEMGANRKVLEAAVSTMIQESTARNLDHGDRDSLGLFQQRPSQGWGTPEQVRDPRHAAKKFFERAIANDRKDPGLSKTRLAQSVQISAFPDAYAKWDAEAEKIVGDFLG